MEYRLRERDVCAQVELKSGRGECGKKDEERGLFVLQRGDCGDGDYDGSIDLRNSGRKASSAGYGRDVLIISSSFNYLFLSLSEKGSPKRN